MSHLDAGALFRAHAGFVAGFLLRLGVERRDLDDTVQEVFMIAHRLGGFTEGDAKPTTWLAAIALRIASDLRRARRRRPDDEGADPAALAGGPTPFDEAVASETRDRIQRALDTLGLEHRAVFVLYEIEDESCDSIAAGLGIPVGTVYSRLHTARRAFQKACAELEASTPVPVRRVETA